MEAYNFITESQYYLSGTTDTTAFLKWKNKEKAIVLQTDWAIQLYVYVCELLRKQLQRYREPKS